MAWGSPDFFCAGVGYCGIARGTLAVMKELWEMDSDVVARVVKNYRLRKGWSARELSRMTGLNRVTLRKVERGEKVEELTLAKLVRVAPELTEMGRRWDEEEGEDSVGDGEEERREVGEEDGRAVELAG